MDLRKVKKLIELLEQSALVEMEITEGESTIRLSRASSQAIAPQQIQMAPMAVSTPAATVVNTPTDNAKSDESEASATGIVIESPMVGTFYDAASPEAGPYVQVGSKVTVGDILCIIEAMKTFNQLEAEVSGIIKAVYKSTGDPVEFGEPLFLID